MEIGQLRENLNQRYDRQRWQDLLRRVLPNVRFYSQPAVIEIMAGCVTSCLQLGEAQLHDGKVIGLFEVEVDERVDVTRSRVQLRNAISSLIDEASIHSVLGIFRDDAPSFRCTFAARESTFTDDGEFVTRETPPKRYTYLLGPDEVCNTAAERFAQLCSKRENLSLPDVRDAFSVEKLNKEFYTQVRNAYTRLIGGALTNGERVECHLLMPGNQHDDTQVRQEFAVRLLSRTIFCWFLKHKGKRQQAALLPTDLLSSTAVEENASYYHAILEKLFFRVLNQPMDERNYARLPAGCERIPYLNGGLFEPHTKDFYRTNSSGDSAFTATLTIPDSWFHDFFSVLEQYNFTIDENTVTDAEVSIDPEILGRIFENLLAEINPETGESARSNTGSFYTPRNVVDYMVQESLIAYLDTELGGHISRADLARLFDDGEEESAWLSKVSRAGIVQALSRIKVLDPACGSGAFPVGVLQNMLTILRKVDPANDMWLQEQFNRVREHDLTPKETDEWLRELEHTFETNAADYGRKLGIICNCIYGVDIQPIAVEIARLRFFLTLVVEEDIHETEPNRGILPLPNLDFKFVCANSLFHAPAPPDNGDNVIGLDFVDHFFDKLADYSRLYFYARTPHRKAELKEVIRGLISQRTSSTVQLIFSHIRTPDGRYQNVQQAKKKAEIAELEREAELWKSYENLFSGDTVDFFDPHFMFPDAADGFHLIIANPPYVRQERIKELKPVLKREYAVDFSGTADLYVFFYLRSLELLRDKGHLCFISSNKYFRSAYGEKLRTRLGADCHVKRLIDFGDAPVFDAIAYPCIVLAQCTAPPAEAHSLVLEWDQEDDIRNFEAVVANKSFAMPQLALAADGWKLERPDVLALLDKLRNAGTPLGEYVKGRFYYGIKTGYNEAFVVDRATRDRLIAEHPSSEELLKPFLRGRDVKRWKVEFADQWLIFVPWHFPLQNDTTIKGASPEAEAAFAEQYPAVFQHLSRFRKQLESRNKAETGIRYEWYCLQRCAATYYEEFSQPKIFVPAIDNRANFAIDKQSMFGNDKTSICVTEHCDYVAGILNSTVIWWFLGKQAATRQGGFIEFKPMYVTQLPIPHADRDEKTRLAVLVEQLTSQEHTFPPIRAEAEIDARVAFLFGLNADEYDMILNLSSNSEPFRVIARNFFEDLLLGVLA